ncbi:unnamed protein product [Echinostoma caproni]|uniref:Uncharacterized protein n=1 Tax=Echinostoma caproni TaxID=27848 RepID=A0A3P8HQK1_9TREM|nr:unnamed protein product [Echinostoma caproni]
MVGRAENLFGNPWYDVGLVKRGVCCFYWYNRVSDKLFFGLVLTGLLEKPK